MIVSGDGGVGEADARCSRDNAMAGVQTDVSFGQEALLEGGSI